MVSYCVDCNRKENGKMYDFDRYGSLCTADGRPSLRFERRLSHPPEKVWQAITKSEELSRWFPADLQGNRTSGGKIRIVSFTGQFPPAVGKFTAYEPPRLLEYTWGNEILRWELRPGKAGCVLVFTNVLDDNAVSIGRADIASAWHACLDVLDFVLADQNPPYSTNDRVVQVNPEYIKRFGKTAPDSGSASGNT